MVAPHAAPAAHASKLASSSLRYSKHMKALTAARQRLVVIEPVAATKVSAARTRPAAHKQRHKWFGKTK